MIKAVIFDMDGVLVDTEPLADLHFPKYLKRFGVTLPKDYLEQFRGSTSRVFWTKTRQSFKLTQSIEYLMEDARKSYLKFIKASNLKSIAGIKDFIKTLTQNSFKVAVASSASSKRIETILGLVDLEEIFEIKVSGDDIKNAKPHPEVYLLTAKLLGIKPPDCLVIEDSTNGILSAKSAGMKVVGFSGMSHNIQDLSKADLVIKSFNDLTLETINSF